VTVRPRYLVLVALLLLCASAVLYLPWRNNPLVFDDPNILSSPALGDYAQRPLSLAPRQFPYFTLGFEHVVSGGNLLVSRYVNICVHAANAFLLFMLSLRLLGRMLSAQRAFIAAAILALIFAVHPVAVYGVGYLVQRTILLATFFLLASAWQFDKALADRSWLRGLWAGLCFAMAVFSKEHAITGFIGILGIVLLHKSVAWRSQATVAASFLAIVLPCVLWVASLKLGLVAIAYEPDAQDLISAVGFPDAGTRLGNWALSAALQCQLFFRYLGLWWWPNPQGMGIDLRPDINAMAQLPNLIAGPAAFVMLTGFVVYVLISQRFKRLIQFIAFGLLWALSLFLVELSTVRFQEPLVLYRSYLWAPGLLLAGMGFISLVRGRVALALAFVAVLALGPIAWGRLHTFSNELALWEEAQAKLPQPTSAGAIRIHYNRGVQRQRIGQIAGALEDFEWVIAQDPNLFQGYWARSSVRLMQNDMQGAVADLQTVIRLKPEFAEAYFRLGWVLKRQGQKAASEIAFGQAKALGMPILEFK